MVFVDVIGKPITVGVIRQIEDKTAKDGNGNYQATGETRTINVADKFFHTESKRTVTEFLEQLDEAAFYSKWVEKNKGKDRNRAKGAEGKSGAPANRPAAAGGEAGGQKKKSLFGG